MSLFHSIVFVLLLLIQPAAAITAVTGATEANRPPLKEWQKTLDEAEKELNVPEIANQRLTEIREQLLNLKNTIRESRDTAHKQADLVRSDLDALGSPPAEGALAEAPNVVKRRAHLSEQMATAEGIVKEADLLMARAERAAETIKQLRLQRFTERILTRSESPLDPGVWVKAAPEWGSVWESAAGALKMSLTGKDDRQDKQAMSWRLVELGLALLLAFPLRLWLARRMLRSLPEGEPSYFQRFRLATLAGLLRAMLPSLAAVAVYFSIRDVLGSPLAELADDTLVAAILVFMVGGFLHAALRPKRAVLRLAPLHDDGARILSRVVNLLAILFAVDHVLSALLARHDVSVETVAIQNAVFGLLFSLVLAGLLNRRIWEDEQGVIGQGRQRLRYLLMLLVAAIPLSALLGYVALSRLLASRVVGTMGLAALVALLVRIGDEFVAHAVSGASPSGAYLRRHMALTDEGAEMLGFWVGASIKTAILLAGGVTLLLLWSVDKQDTLLWLGAAFQEFKLGSLTISLTEILIGLLLFTALLVATRLLQRALDRRIFPRTRLDSGVQHSIRSAVGYAGFTLAAVLAVSTMGIDLSSLAIIAGALSVGLGFGLQNIVNNFVSGLILLIERPIKTGDWVIVGEHQGYVRKISVRATEIATFDRASVFIPNSSLISGPVTNRTHVDKVGRVLLPVGIAHEADPVKAREVLRAIAEAHPEVRRNPAPAAFMTGFGDNALNLELVAFIRDVDKLKAVTSDLCFAIHEAFRQQGISIPYPQRELRVSLDDEQLRRVFGEAASEQADSGSTPSGGGGGTEERPRPVGQAAARGSV